MGSSTTTDCETDTACTTLARSLAPEEVRVNDWVGVLYEVCELPLIMWECGVEATEREEIVRLAITPYGDCEPLHVRAVCLPFVLVKPKKGKVRQIDVRRQRLARLDPAFAKVWAQKSRKKKRKK
ncbi:hypothetical protein [Adhaeretor mobilis]|uniref:Uncharacterized protein n=1 Tax=Adhaeretor mobilis TaxID=1930276 RepID=A0A517MPQ9_9BACT|nr:hypothetical protein [Adhaeretor mobilis]QDS96854.1 hypothetical protein HG15A2_01120 [Adhaeretor mobilis]